jgi:hypothetical protein
VLLEYCQRCRRRGVLGALAEIMTARTLVQTLPCAIVFASLAVSAQAQAVDDGVMLPKGNLVVGDIYLHDEWDEY